MARIEGVDLPRNKRVDIALTYIFGIGRKTAGDICDAANVARDVKAGDLSETEVAAIRTIIQDSYQVEGDREGGCHEHQGLIDIGAYRGLRHKYDCRSWSAHSHQRPHTQGPRPDCRASPLREG